MTKRLGLGYAFLWLCTTLVRRLSLHIFVVTTHPIDNQPPDADLDMAGFEARLLTCDDVTRFFDRDQGYGYSRAFAAEALSRGDRCVGVFEHGRLLWYCWYARGVAPVFDDVECTADWPFLYGYNVYTHPAYRGRGLHEIGINASASVFAREGCRAFTAYIEADNLPPLVAARKMGEDFVGFVVVHRTLGAVPWFATRGCQKAGFRICRRPAISERTESGARKAHAA